MRYSALRCLLSVFLALALFPSVFSQRRQAAPAIAIQISGQLRYARGGAPAANIVVRLEEPSGGTVAEVMTDQTGKFHFTSLSQGQYQVSVHLTGFKDVRQSVELETSTSQYLPLLLIPEDSDRATSRGKSSTVDARCGDPSRAARPECLVSSEAQQEFGKAQAALSDDRIDEGIQHLEKAISLYPRFLEAQLVLGTSYMDVGQWEKAERALRRALEINANAAPALFALGEVYLRQKRLPDAEKSLLSGLKLNEQSWQGHLALGRAYWEMGAIAKAGPQVGRALQLKPDLAAGHLLAGNILLRAHQPDNAITEFEEYLRLAPKGEFSEQTRAVVQKLKLAAADHKN
jgi:tetratricopeptide (TPR) repeat protein